MLILLAFHDILFVACFLV